MLIGSVAGVLARLPIRRSAAALLMDVALGLAGAVLGGWLSNASRGAAGAPVTLGSLLLALLGAIVVLAFYHSVVRGRIEKDR